MKCAICKNGSTRPGETTGTLTKGDTTAVFRKVPAKVCQNCKEAYVSDEVTEELLTKAQVIADEDVQVDAWIQRLSATVSCSSVVESGIIYSLLFPVFPNAFEGVPLTRLK